MKKIETVTNCKPVEKWKPSCRLLVGGFLLVVTPRWAVGLSYHGSRKMGTHNAAASMLRLPRCDSPTGRRDYSTTIFRVSPPNFTKYRPCGNSMVVLPSISLFRMVCPSILLIISFPVPSTVKRPCAGLG